MTGKQLKNAILQLAIQGKLVPQDSTDEPASVLLAQIRKEKEQLLKAGKLKKKDLETTPISDEEKPFEIPESWEWCRMTEIIFPPKYGTSSKSSTSGKMIVLRMGNIQDGKIVYDKLVFSNNNEDNKKYLLYPNDILFNRTNSAELVGKTAIYKGELPAIYAGYLILLRTIQVAPDYINYLYNSPYVRDYCNEVKTIGVQQCNINAEKISQLLIPLPPLAEQKRIVAKIEELMPLVEEYGVAQEKLNHLNEALPEALKKSILQQAIQGKLVPQDANDEPASVLLSRIRKEKEQLVKAGKLKKKDLATTPITDEEKPFEIPERWEWVRLGEISTYACTKKKINAADAASQLWGLDLEDIEKGGRLLNRKTVGERKAIGDKTFFNKGDILYSKLRPYLLKILVAPEVGICTPEIIPFSCFGDIDKEFIVNVLKSSYVDDYINSVTFGIKMPRVGTETMTSLLIPLPPLAEQRRIVAKVEELMALVDGMK